jgi:hypothetical protein
MTNKTVLNSLKNSKMKLKVLLSFTLILLSISMPSTAWAIYQIPSNSVGQTDTKSIAIPSKSMTWKEKLVYTLLKKRIKKATLIADEPIKKQTDPWAILGAVLPLITLGLAYIGSVGFTTTLIALLISIICCLIAFFRIAANPKEKKGVFLGALGILLSIISLIQFNLGQR